MTPGDMGPAKKPASSKTGNPTIITILKWMLQSNEDLIPWFDIFDTCYQVKIWHMFSWDTYYHNHTLDPCIHMTISECHTLDPCIHMYVYLSATHLTHVYTCMYIWVPHTWPMYTHVCIFECHILDPWSYM